jgi:CMP-N-acetylneuraminic acid synthetase
MNFKNNTIAIITARGGSKRIKNKNIISFFGKPMIFYSINCAKKSKLFSEIFVSTDSKKIKKISLKYGASVPFLRTKKLSDDITGTREVVKSFLQNLKKKYKYVCCIYPTAPLMRVRDLIRGYEKIKKNASNYIFSGNISKKSENSFFFNNKNFVDSGQFYWATYETWIKKSKIINEKSLIIKIPELYSQDLNTYEDLKILKEKALNIFGKV